MRQAIKLIIVFSLFLSIAVSLGNSGLTYAQGDEHSTTATQTTAYEYTVRPNDNLSLLVRRSLQLYSSAKGISLSPAAAMYSETLLTQRINNPSLEVNQRISIPFNLLEEFISSSKNLSAAQITAWNTYAQSANFKLESVVPTNADAVKQTLEPQTSSTQTSDKEQTTLQENKDENQSEEDSKTSDSKDKWWWVVLVAAIVVSASFLYSRRAPSK